MGSEPDPSDPGIPDAYRHMIHPPVTDTGWVTDAVRESVAAKVIAYLASDTAALITGNVITLR
jgi:3-oxoacyl-[acyl-carrier protein] reductase